MAGHITDKMWDKYSRVRMESIREKMTEALSGCRRKSILCQMNHSMILTHAVLFALIDVALSQPFALAAGRPARRELVHVSEYDPIRYLLPFCLCRFLR